MLCLTIGSSTVPRTYGYELVQSSLRQTLLQSSFYSTTALTFRREQLPTWVSALFSTSLRCVHIREDSHIPTLFRPQAIAASRRFAPQYSLRTYFIPQPSPGLYPVQGFIHSVQVLSFIRRTVPPRH